MNFLSTLLLVAFTLVFSLPAQDFGPVKVDLEGYINDRNEEPVKPVVSADKTPKVEVKQPETQTKTATPATRTSPPADTPGNLNTLPATTNNQPVEKISLDQFSARTTGSSTILYIVIIAIVLVLTGVVVFILKKKKQKSTRLAHTAMSSATTPFVPKASVNQQNLAAETTQDQPTIYSHSQIQMESASRSMADRFAKETSLNKYGQNSSGIIIDEDKYFAGTEPFVDEDFSDLDEPQR